MAVIGELATLITARVEPFTKGLRTAGKQADTFSRRLRTSIGRGLDSVNRKLVGFVSSLGKLGVATGVGALLWSGKLAMDFERAQLSFAVLLKDEKKAADLMKQIQKFAAKTPFSATDITKATQKLSAYGYEVSELQSMWEQIGNTAAITGADMVTLAEILGRVRTQNRADLMDVNRIADRAGFFYDALAKRLNVATGEVREMAQQGKITADVFAGAFKDMTTGTGQLAGGLDKLSLTVFGRWTTLVDNIKETLTKVGLEIFKGIDIKELEDKFTVLIKTYRDDVIEATVEGVRTITELLSALPGMYRGARDIWDRIQKNKAQIKQWTGGTIANQLDPGESREYWRDVQTSSAREVRDIEQRAEERYIKDLVVEARRGADALEEMNTSTATVGAL